ncbi:GIY-YIG nuclease family protein [Rhodohalobacter sp. 614A]|uniref:GIY-YIG nuclease family protein n=1 Tax=Rhodohalobacter sp. 614A TaxID=2908649 RepID=UPI001F29544F|nr:GIY-YIG nuclease family protein [Rhodohalobacter sp. 614A]
MFHIYMLYSAVVDRYYVGQTSNLEDRLKRHNQGRSKYTKSGIPWKLVYKEGFETRSEAMKRESLIKNSASREELVRFISSKQNELKTSF